MSTTPKGYDYEIRARQNSSALGEYVPAGTVVFKGRARTATLLEGLRKRLRWNHFEVVIPEAVQDRIAAENKAAAESARRQAEAQAKAEEAAAKAKAEQAASLDEAIADLSQLDGIGTQLATMLHENGIHSRHQLTTVAADAHGREELIALPGITETNLAAWEGEYDRQLAKEQEQAEAKTQAKADAAAAEAGDQTTDEQTGEGDQTGKAGDA
jgi:predicted flap endonuclease-1-like 5' DNA nuclease